MICISPKYLVYCCNVCQPQKFFYLLKFLNFAETAPLVKNIDFSNLFRPTGHSALFAHFSPLCEIQPRNDYFYFSPILIIFNVKNYNKKQNLIWCQRVLTQHAFCPCHIVIVCSIASVASRSEKGGSALCLKQGIYKVLGLANSL